MIGQAHAEAAPGLRGNWPRQQAALRRGRNISRCSEIFLAGKKSSEVRIITEASEGEPSLILAAEAEGSRAAQGRAEAAAVGPQGEGWLGSAEG